MYRQRRHSDVRVNSGRSSRPSPTSPQSETWPRRTWPTASAGPSVESSRPLRPIIAVRRRWTCGRPTGSAPDGANWQRSQWHALAVEHPRKVMVRRDQERCRVAERCVIGEPRRIAMAVRANDRARSHLRVELPGDRANRAINREEPVGVEFEGMGHARLRRRCLGSVLRPVSAFLNSSRRSLAAPGFGAR